MPFEPHNIRLHLLRHAQLHLFWIRRTEQIQPGLIHYLGNDGTPYMIMDDDDVRVEKCIEFLEGAGCPVFDDIDEMDSYARKLQESNPGST